MPEFSKTRGTAGKSKTPARKTACGCGSIAGPSKVLASFHWENSAFRSRSCSGVGAAMKLRLHVHPGQGPAHFTDTEGPIIRLGRNPECEVPLQGVAAQGVSWIHAQIELTPQGAFLTDLESTNGTYLNERRIGRPLPAFRAHPIPPRQTR